MVTPLLEQYVNKRNDRQRDRSSGRGTHAPGTDTCPHRSHGSSHGPYDIHELYSYVLFTFLSHTREVVPKRLKFHVLLHHRVNN